MVKVYSLFLSFCLVVVFGINSAETNEALQAPYIYHSVNVITGSYVESTTDLELDGPHPLLLRRCYQSEIRSTEASVCGWLTSLPSLFTAAHPDSVPLPNKAYHYEYDAEGRLTKAQSLLASGGVCRAVDFSYVSNSDGFTCVVKADDQTVMTYNYEVDTANRGNYAVYLKSVERQGTPLISYEYEKHPLTRSQVLTRRNEPNQRSLVIEYYDREVNDVGGVEVVLDNDAVDRRWGKVKVLKSPVGEDAEPVITHCFFYGDGYTEVRDALGHKIVYRYGKSQRLTAIEYYDDTDALYRTEKFTWKEGAVAPLMLARWLEDAEGKEYSRKNFTYDKQGNLVKECLLGDLTGKGNKKEWFDVKYKYDGQRITSKEEGPRLKVSYIYNKQKQLVGEHQIIDGMFHVRTFKDYDEDGYVVRTIIDNGTAQKCDDLKGVQQRQITTIVPSKEAASYGLPSIIDKSYLDVESKTEITLSKTINEYSSRGDLVRQQSFAADGTKTQDVQYSYDDHGRMILSCEERGNVTAMNYDDNGNVIMVVEHTPEGRTTSKKFQYDYSDRLIYLEETNHRGEVVVSRYQYDVVSLKTAESVDGAGTTTYTYDAFGRIIEMRQAPIIGADDCIQWPITTYRYDVRDNIISTVGPAGDRTDVAYNDRCKPVNIHHSDGSTESFLYDVCGQLVQEYARDGAIKSYEYDGLNRLLKTVTNGESIETSVYNSFQLLLQTDATGGRTIYRYDGAGRVIELVQHTADASKFMEISYDSHGRFSERRTRAAGAMEIEHFEYDIDNQVTTISVYDEEGNFIKEHKIQEKETAEQDCRMGLEMNSLGQQVFFSEEVQEDGSLIKVTYDTLRRPFTVERKNSFGQILSSVAYRYDLAGNKVREIYQSGVEESPFIIARSYGAGNKLESEIEGFGSPQQRVTSYTYDTFGQLIKMVKADGISLSYGYSADGKVSEMYSSDHSVHYAYEYDAHGHITAIHDRLTGTVTRRHYSGKQLDSEEFAHGLYLNYSYNEDGRRRLLTFPDGSSVRYEYQGQLLKTLERLDASQQVVYTHMDQVCEDGRVKKSHLAGNVGELEVSYESGDKKSSIKTPYWSEDLRYDGSGQLKSSIIKDAAGEHTSDYSYNEYRRLASENGTAFTYDAWGNAGLNGSEYDSLNQLTALNHVSFEYDANGNLIRQFGSGEQSYGYDALNRLQTVVNGDGTTTTYTYDGFNRRLMKTSVKNGREICCERYLYDGKCEIGAVSKSGKINQLRLLAPTASEVGSAVAIELNGRSYVPVHDHRGNVAALVDMQDRELIESYRYTAYGEKTIIDGDGNECEESSVGMPWGFSSKRYDDETGWTFYGLRHYSPEMCRWTTPDPLGYIDGPNRYLFVRNNPVVNHDQFGGFSIGELWNSSIKMLGAGADKIGNLINAFQKQVGYSHYSKHEIEAFANVLVGSFFLRLTGFYTHKTETGVVGKGEISDKVRVSMVNGILNYRGEYVKMVAFFSQVHGDVNIHYIYRPSSGWAADLFGCVPSKLGFISSRSRIIARTWKKLIREMGGPGEGGLIIHYAHSIGGAETNNAKRLLTPEERKMIRVVTLGSATLIPDGDFHSVSNYVSWRDGVCYFDPIGYIRALLNHDTNIYFVGSPWGIPIIDHLLEGESYTEIIQMLGADFVRTYGSL